jgi:Ig-like domain from next to BRCA1 gene
MWGMRPTCTPFLRSLSPRLSSYEIINAEGEKMKKAAIVLLLFLALIACNFSTLMQAPTPTPTVENPEVSTANLLMTQLAGATASAAAATATPIPIATAFPTVNTTPTDTSLPPTPTDIPPTATVTLTSSPVPIDAAEFIVDVTIPDGTRLSPGVSFVKTWRLRNRGTTTWTIDYSLIFANGSHMNGLSLIPLSKTVAPGGTIDVSVILVAPSSPGTYQGSWELRSASGILFGVGPKADKPFFVNIKVSSPPPAFAVFPYVYCIIPTWREKCQTKITQNISNR